MRCLLVLQSDSRRMRGRRRRRKRRKIGEEEEGEKKEGGEDKEGKLQQDVFTCSLVSRPVQTGSDLLHLSLPVLQEADKASRQWQPGDTPASRLLQDVQPAQLLQRQRSSWKKSSQTSEGGAGGGARPWKGGEGGLPARSLMALQPS